MFPPPDVKAIFFDLDNTLVDRNGALASYLPRWLRKYCPSLPQNQYAAEVARIMQYDNWGYTDRTQFCEWLMHTYNLPEAFAENLLPELLLQIPQHIRPHPHCLRLVEQLKTRVVVGIISNGSGKTQRAKLQQAGLSRLFDPYTILISGEIGYAKPHPFLFAEAARRVKVKPDEILFVGDDPVNDMLGASRAGQKTCWIMQHRSFPPIGIQPDYSIPHILDITSVFAYA